MAEEIRLGLLGNNLGRSRAKNLHELLGELYGLTVTYNPMDLVGSAPPVSIRAELERCRAEGYRGVNVTHPYKREAFNEVVTMASFPVGLTSVNTVLFTGTDLLADNTDYSGFCRAYVDIFGKHASPGRVLMLGAGGVGVAIAYGLRTLQADELVIADLDHDLAAGLVAQMNECGLAARVATPDLMAEMAVADGLVNATPIGMFQYPGCAFPLSGLGRQRWTFDAVYTPENTVFLDACRKQGIMTMSGFALFLFQGLDAFRHFTGIDPDAIAVKPVFLRRFPLE